MTTVGVAINRPVNTEQVGESANIEVRYASFHDEIHFAHHLVLTTLDIHRGSVMPVLQAPGQGQASRVGGARRYFAVDKDFVLPGGWVDRFRLLAPPDIDRPWSAKHLHHVDDLSGLGSSISTVGRYPHQIPTFQTEAGRF
jgi:hypothetical protein